MKRFIILLAVGALAIAACASDGGPSETTSDTLPMAENDDVAAAEGADEPIPVEPNEGIGDGASGLDLPVVSPDLLDETEAAVADLAERLGDDVLIRVVAAHEVTWSDGSLGCPKPDGLYTQALVDGYRIELSDGAESYEYHGQTGGEPFLCEQSQSVSEETRTSRDDAVADPAEGVDHSAWPGTAAIAAEDLASRLGVDIDEVELVSHEGVTWPDASLGCPQKGKLYAQVLTVGTRTILEVGDARFSYHAGSDATPFLCSDPQDPLPPGVGDT